MSNGNQPKITKSNDHPSNMDLCPLKIDIWKTRLNLQYEVVLICLSDQYVFAVFISQKIRNSR